MALSFVDTGARGAFLFIDAPAIQLQSGCKESQFYGLTLGQVVASMYTSPRVFLTSPKNF